MISHPLCPPFSLPLYLTFCLSPSSLSLSPFKWSPFIHGPLPTPGKHNKEKTRTTWWISHGGKYDIYPRLCVFWTVFIANEKWLLVSARNPPSPPPPPPCVWSFSLFGWRSFGIVSVLRSSLWVIFFWCFTSVSRQYDTKGDGVVAQLIEHLTGTPLTKVRFPATARDFSPRVKFQCRLSYGVRTPPCAIACIYICAHVKDSVVHVRVRWIMETLKQPA